MLLRREIQLSIRREHREGVTGRHPIVKVLIVDDQAHARDSLNRLCARADDVQVVGEAACGMTAIEAAGNLNPDIMLLDVELPDMTGFELLRAVAADGGPLGIMVSNCADHAIRAFARPSSNQWRVSGVQPIHFELIGARPHDAGLTAVFGG
jgi:CheY-like chemotaxis protein